GINGGFERFGPLVNNLSIARPRRNPQPLALAHSACRPAIRTESLGLSLPPGTFDSWKMPPHRGAISSDHVRVEGLRRYQSSVLFRRIAPAGAGSSVSERMRRMSDSIFAITSRASSLSAGASFVRTRMSIEL